MIGLKRGEVFLSPHDSQWKTIAENTIRLLHGLLGQIAVDIQHVGSTAIPNIHAKPIVDIAVGVAEMEDILPYKSVLSANGIVYHREAVKGQMLFLIGDSDRGIVTHHVHIVRYGSEAWQNYVNFRDYLRTFPQKAQEYDGLKMRLASLYANDRKSYTAGKEKLIQTLLQEAAAWRTRAG